MKVELQERKIWQIVNENFVAPIDKKALEAFNMKNELATSMIFHAMLDDVFLMISSSTLAKEARDKLKKIYLGSKFSRRFIILKKLLVGAIRSMTSSWYSSFFKYFLQILGTL